MLDTAGATLEEIDETISLVFGELKIDCYGNRMSEYKRNLLQSILDDLLDTRLELTRGNPDKVEVG